LPGLLKPDDFRETADRGLIWKIALRVAYEMRDQANEVQLADAFEPELPQPDLDERLAAALKSCLRADGCDLSPLRRRSRLPRDCPCLRDKRGTVQRHWRRPRPRWPRRWMTRIQDRESCESGGTMKRKNADNLDRMLSERLAKALAREASGLARRARTRRNEPDTAHCAARVLLVSSPSYWPLLPVPGARASFLAQSPSVEGRGSHASGSLSRERPPRASRLHRQSARNRWSIHA